MKHSFTLFCVFEFLRFETIIFATHSTVKLFTQQQKHKTVYSCINIFLSTAESVRQKYQNINSPYFRQQSVHCIVRYVLSIPKNLLFVLFKFFLKKLQHNKIICSFANYTLIRKHQMCIKNMKTKE